MLFYSIQEIAVIQTKDVGGVESPPPPSLLFTSFPKRLLQYVLVLKRSLQDNIKTLCFTITSLRLTFVHKCISPNSKIVFRWALNRSYLKNVSYKRFEDRTLLLLLQELESLRINIKFGRFKGLIPPLSRIQSTLLAEKRVRERGAGSIPEQRLVMEPSLSLAGFNSQVQFTFWVFKFRYVTILIQRLAKLRKTIQRTEFKEFKELELFGKCSGTKDYIVRNILWATDEFC